MRSTHKEGVKYKLNFVINFERYVEEHTGVNIRLWLNKRHKKATIKPSYVGHHYVDGASNAWASVEEF